MSCHCLRYHDSPESRRAWVGSVSIGSSFSNKSGFAFDVLQSCFGCACDRVGNGVVMVVVLLTSILWLGLGGFGVGLGWW